MKSEPRNMRLDGIYKQRQEGFFMQRVKLPAGVLSAEQACKVAAVADRFGRGAVHLTTRGSMEIHWIKEEDLPVVKQELAKVGLTSRGACGGAVRGVTCSSQGAASFPALESLARRLQRHFTGNPRFEGLPKKFKIGVEADSTSGRHLIQDAGLVLAGFDAGVATYDVWIAGGLGREPRPGFLLVAGVREERLVPVIEAVVTVYARLAPPPKRLKFLARELGEDELRRLIEAEPVYGETMRQADGFADNLTPAGEEGRRLLVPVFAGQLTSGRLRELAAFAEEYSAGVLQVTADQDVAYVLAGDADADRAARELKTVTEPFPVGGFPVTFRICPGNHECSMGLAATREIASELLAAMSPAARESVWAISGCPNSCSQPQLASFGVVVAKLAPLEDGSKAPRFDLYRRSAAGLGEKVREQLALEELSALVRAV